MVHSLELDFGSLNKLSGSRLDYIEKMQSDFGVVLLPILLKYYFKVYLNPFPKKPLFLCVCSTGLSKTLWEDEKLLVTSNFSFSHSVFYPFEELPAIFILFEIVVCKLFQFRQV